MLTLVCCAVTGGNQPVVVAAPFEAHGSGVPRVEIA